MKTNKYLNAKWMNAFINEINNAGCVVTFFGDSGLSQ